MGQTQNIEQQIQFLSNLQLGFGIAALLFLALAIFLFFYLHIPQVFNEYRGKSAQKAMEEMAANSSDSGRIVSMDKKSKNKKKGTGQLVQRRHYTDNLTDDLSGRMGQEFGEPTGQMNLNMANSSEANDMMQETAANGSEATDVLDAAMMSGAEGHRRAGTVHDGRIGSYRCTGSVYDRQPGTGKTACIYTGTGRNHGSGSEHAAAFQQYL